VDIDPEFIALMDVVVDHCGKQVVGRANGMDIACKVKVNVLHWQDLGIPAAGCAALHTESGPK
jgi:hypothetical protein